MKGEIFQALTDQNGHLETIESTEIMLTSYGTVQLNLLLKKLNLRMAVGTGVSLFTGCLYSLDWTTGLDYWTTRFFFNRTKV